MIWLNKKRAGGTVVRQEPLISAPQRLGGHFLYILLYEMVLVSALWQHGHPILTLSLMAATVPLGFSAYVPYRWISRQKRFITQLIIIFIAGAWFFYRLHTAIPVDKALAECICTAGLCFILAQRTEDYDYLMLVSFMMLLYGALLPRTVYILIYPLALLLMIALFYGSRVRSLSRQPNLETPPRVIRRNWYFLLIHLALAIFLAWYIFLLFPLEKAPGTGIFQVSFVTENDLQNNADSAKWIQSVNLRKKPDAIKSMTTDGQDATDVTTKPKAPTNPNLPSQKNAAQQKTSGSGNSSEAPSTDLVFRVKSPLKLYWLAKLFDHYDGHEWTATPWFSEPANVSNSNYNPKIIRESISLDFILSKWVSYSLYSAYRATHFDLTNYQKRGDIFKVNSYTAELLQVEYPPVPFRYRVTSTVSLPAKSSLFRDPPNYWEERLSRQHYLLLPNKAISQRLRDKTAEIIKGVKAPYDRAIRLRDYLRNSYPYEQFATPLPDDKEMADFFVFELKTGHCEYFAATLAVMARIAGLPSRVAIGFSPGNYNALTGFFEVHEYHAHAWTQIFIEGMGWLTFDPTPPGNVQSRTTPFGIGSLRDPFGDSWRVTPPEITPETQKVITKEYAKRLAREGEELNVAEKLLLSTAEAPDNIREKVTAQVDRMFPKVPGHGLEKLRYLGKQLKARINLYMQHGARALTTAWHWALAHWILVFPLIMLLTALAIFFKMLRFQWFRYRHLRRELHYLRAAYNSKDPAEIIQQSYLAVREMLLLLEFPRRNHQELLQYAATLKTCSPRLAYQVISLFIIYTRYTYSNREMTSRDAAKALHRAALIHRFTRLSLGKRWPWKRKY